MELLDLISANKIPTLLIVLGSICVLSYFFDEIAGFTPRKQARRSLVTLGVVLIIAGSILGLIIKSPPSPQLSTRPELTATPSTTVSPVADRQTFVGRISDAEGNPIRGAEVSLQARGVPRVRFSDSEGIVSFPVDGSGSARLIIEAAGYEKYDRHIEPSEGSGPEDIRLNLLRPEVPPPATAQQNLLRNPGFEEVEDGTVVPTQWSTASYSGAAEPSLDGEVVRSGRQSVRIAALAPDHARWKQRVKVKPAMLYRLTGWVRTENVGPTAEGVNKGASLAVSEPHIESQGVLGTRNWTFVSLDFDSGQGRYVEIALQLGTYGGQTTGTAWFDDIRFYPVEE